MQSITSMGLVFLRFWEDEKRKNLAEIVKGVGEVIKRKKGVPF